MTQELTLWPFALAFYKQPDVAQTCLALQDQNEVDVNVLIYAAWLGFVRGRTASGEDLAGLDNQVAEWRQEVVHPLRSIRRRLKSGPRPAPAPNTEALRNKIKAAELQAEALELEVLESLAPEPAKAEDREAAISATRSNMRYVIELYSGRKLDADNEAALDVLCGALTADFFSAFDIP